MAHRIRQKKVHAAMVVMMQAMKKSKDEVPADGGVVVVALRVQFRLARPGEAPGARQRRVFCRRLGLQAGWRGGDGHGAGDDGNEG